MKILALDIATTTGWAVLEIKGKKANINYGSITVNSKNRLKEINNEVKTLIKNHRPDIVLIEDVFFSRNFKSFKILSMMHAATYLGCVAISNPIILEANATAIRKAIGVKNTEREKIKPLVMKMINQMFGIRLKDNDVTDAIAIIIAYLNDKKVFRVFGQ